VGNLAPLRFAFIRTREVLDPTSLHLLEPLAEFVPPAMVIYKPVYSAFLGSTLRQTLMERDADGLIVTGAETDVCALATVLDAIDLDIQSIS
jgi:nicotinamidase-related amidase